MSGLNALRCLTRYLKRLERIDRYITKHTTKQNETLWTRFAAFLKSKSAECGERTIAKYETLRRVLHDFEKPLITSKRKLTNSTVGKYITTLKTILARAEDRGSTLPKDNSKFKVDEEDVEVIAVTLDELHRIVSLDLSNNPRLDRVRDLFVFACYTGARFGDVQALHLDDVKENTWHLRMGKTKSETRIPLIPQAIEIIHKYRQQSKMPSISSQRMNDYLKELGKQVEINAPVRSVRYRGARRIEDRGQKWEFMSSHMARRTFVTLSLELGMRPEMVMGITGHRSFKTMKKYIAITDDKQQEEFHKAWSRQESF